MSQYTVCRDTREHQGQGWEFAPSKSCAGTETVKLDTGDYSIKGLETKFVIERKASTSEFAANVFQDRFERELQRLDQFDHAFLLLEFTHWEVDFFPQGSGIPTYKHKFLKMTPELFRKRIAEIQVAHPKLNVWFVGSNGKLWASCLFKRMAEAYLK